MFIYPCWCILWLYFETNIWKTTETVSSYMANSLQISYFTELIQPHTHNVLHAPWQPIIYVIFIFSQYYINFWLFSACCCFYSNAADAFWYCWLKCVIVVWVVYIKQQDVMVNVQLNMPNICNWIAIENETNYPCFFFICVI